VLGGFTKHNIRFTCPCLTIPSTHNQIIQAIAIDIDPSGKSNAGKSYVVFGKADGSAINLSAIAAANNPTGGFVINGEATSDLSIGYNLISTCVSACD
jgi:hypothetical protein